LEGYIVKTINYSRKGAYPARTTIGINFAHIGDPDGLQVQIDGIAYIDKK
jgi:hypothetical protein